jgi:hypothetical protein
MKKLLAAVFLATVLSSPALAQSYDPSIGSGNLNAAPIAAVSQSSRARPTTRALNSCYSDLRRV